VIDKKTQDDDSERKDDLIDDNISKLFQSRFPRKLNVACGAWNEDDVYPVYDGTMCGTRVQVHTSHHSLQRMLSNFQKCVRRIWKKCAMCDTCKNAIKESLDKFALSVNAQFTNRAKWYLAILDVEFCCHNHGICEEHFFPSLVRPLTLKDLKNFQA
jgi:hypothetical protein